MALRWLVLACLISLVVAQGSVAPTSTLTMAPESTMVSAPESTMSSTMAPEPTMASTTELPMAPTPTPTPTPTMAPTMETPTDSPTDVANENLTLAVRYERPDAVAVRNQHFFCPDQGGPFMEDETLNGAMTVRVWSIFLQYPVLAYLDSVKKGVLIEQIVRLINDGGQDTVSTDNICIGRVYHYDVSLYTESVLINIYLRNLTGVSISQINTAFGAANNVNSPYIRSFLGRNAIIIANMTYGMINQNVHPGAFRTGGVRFPEELDPVLNAVILGYWPNQVSLDDLTTNRGFNASVTSNFAENPNPVYYGLTAGDIVFIVISTLLCSLLAFLMVFGFCIQPFFM